MEENKNGDEKSRIEGMRKRLYSREGKGLGLRARRRMRIKTPEVKSGWKAPDVTPSTEVLPVEKKQSPILLILIASVVFFVISLGVSSFFFFSSSGVSPKNVEIVVSGPSTIGGGESLSLQIAVTNKNSVPIESADLIIEYPDGTRSVSDLSIELPRVRESLGTIPAGGRAQKTSKSVLFGKENTQKSISITVEYRVEGSNAIFFADQLYQITIASSPLTLTVESLKEITSGQELEFEAKVKSNSSNIIKDVILSVEYPFGFDFESASPRASFTESVWELGDIDPEGERTIVIKGTLIGEDGEDRVFRFSSGIQSIKDETKLATSFVNTLQSVTIKKPFINVELAFDGSTDPDYTAIGGEKIRVDVTYFNNLPVKITDAELNVQLSGIVLDKLSVSPDRGFYRSIDNTIVWSKETFPTLSSLSPGQSGRVTFSFSSLSLSSGTLFRNPDITLDVTIRGKRFSDSSVPEEVKSTLVRVIKISSDILLTSRALYFSGPFNNSGPLPPQAEKETTYTIVWTATNSSNSVSNAQMTATLPSYMRWMNVVSPSSEKVTFNPVGGKITWEVGDMEPLRGGGAQREVAFQVALLPSLSQIGNALVIVNEQTITGFDEFTQKTITNTKSKLSTMLSTDPGFITGQERVIQ